MHTQLRRAFKKIQDCNTKIIQRLLREGSLPQDAETVWDKHRCMYGPKEFLRRSRPPIPTQVPKARESLDWTGVYGVSSNNATRQVGPMEP